MVPTKIVSALFLTFALGNFLLDAAPASPAVAPAPSPLKIATATASSTEDDHTPAKAIDGVITDDSRWVSKLTTDPSWLEIQLDGVQTLGGIHLYSGENGGSALTDFTVQFMKEGKWEDIPSATILNNQAPALSIPFDDGVSVKTDRLRIWITKSPHNISSILDVVVWPTMSGKIPPVPNTMASVIVPLIYLNQSGFDLGKPKRFTAPTLPDGTPFEVRSSTGDKALFKGVIHGNIGDFSAFEPNEATEFVVTAGGITSVPFRIGPFWLERVTYQNAIDFMIDSRHYVGTARSIRPQSFGWRDDHHFGWELTTLIPQVLSNPSAYERMPHQIVYEAPKNPKLWGKLEPYHADAPDIVKLIHWGADIIVTQGLTHEFFKGQLAYFLYAWPYLRQYLPEQNYQVVHDFAFTHWAESPADHAYAREECDGDNNLLVVKTKLGSTKGGCPPGFSIEPNLLLYEVARREGRPEAEQYFQAAFHQAEWMIANLDWNDPQTTKGQRQSEFITVTGLAHFLREYPDRAPAALQAKIDAWAEVINRRSNNMWDFRKLDDGDRWVPTGDKPHMWNEVGNVVGLPAALLAAQPYVTDLAIRARFDQLIWSHFDNAFGRNPVGRHFSYRAAKEIEGVETGWFSNFPGGNGQLENVRFVLDGAPKNVHYPYHPEKGDFGWTEGWIEFNTAFNVSLAYLAYSDTKITATCEGTDLVVRLEAPLNFDYTKVESGTVVVTTPSGDEEKVTVTEESANSKTFVGRIPIEAANAPVKADGKVQASPGTEIDAAYGYGYLSRHSRVTAGTLPTR